MKAFVSLVVAHLCMGVVFGGETCDTVQENLETACEFPAKMTLISAPNNKQVDGNNCNAEYVKGEWQSQPTIIYPDAKADKIYTLVNVDPDPPGYSKGQYYLHWLVSNIKGEDFAKGDLSKANHLQSYYGPAPPAGSGVHRYMFLAFEENQPGLKLENLSRRSKFELAPWLQKQGHLCGPIAGIQFRTQF